MIKCEIIYEYGDRKATLVYREDGAAILSAATNKVVEGGFRTVIQIQKSESKKPTAKTENDQKTDE